MSFHKLWFRCVTRTVKELSADKKHLGAGIGLTAVLHTWGRNLSFHPHIHCIVPAGGLNSLGLWADSKKKFFLPLKALSRKFRGKLLALLKQQISDMEQHLLDSCYNKEWVVYCKPSFKTAACVVEYLGRYTHRVAISNNRILGMENGQVTFKWRDYRDSSRWKEMTISAEEFIRRFLMQILPPGLRCKLLTETSLTKRERRSTEALLTGLLGIKPPVC